MGSGDRRRWLAGRRAGAVRRGSRRFPVGITRSRDGSPAGTPGRERSVGSEQRFVVSVGRRWAWCGGSYRAARCGRPGGGDVAPPSSGPCGPQLTAKTDRPRCSPSAGSLFSGALRSDTLHDPGIAAVCVGAAARGSMSAKAAGAGGGSTSKRRSRIWRPRRRGSRAAAMAWWCARFRGRDTTRGSHEPSKIRRRGWRSTARLCVRNGAAPAPADAEANLATTRRRQSGQVYEPPVASENALRELAFA